jgi:hypothetical protein
LSQVVGVYLNLGQQRCWVGEPPDIDFDPRRLKPGERIDLEKPDLTRIFDEVHRETLPSGINVRVLKLGIVFFDFAKLHPGTPHTIEAGMEVIAGTRVAHASLLNVYLLCLASAIGERGLIVHKQFVRPEDVIAVADGFDGKVFWRPGGTAFESDLPKYSELTRNYFCFMAGRETLRHNALVEWTSQVRMRLVIDVDTVRASLAKFDGLVLHPRAVPLVSLLAQAFNAFEDYDYSLALIASWAIVENLLGRMWEALVEDRTAIPAGSNGIASKRNASRKNRLDDGRSFTPAVVAEILEFQGALPFALYELSVDVRQARNLWIHELKVPTVDQARHGIELAIALLRRVEEIDLDLEPVFSVHVW